MARYIDADALSYRLEKRIDSVTDLSFAEGLSEAIVEIGLSPTLSPDEVRGVGEWEHQELAPTNWTFCSVCGRQRSKKYKWYYCPNCGAKMTRAEAEKAMEVSEDA